MALAIVTACSAVALAQTPAVPNLAPWRTEDLLDERLDVDAQYALMRLFRGTADQVALASDVLAALKSGALAGIHRVDRRAVAARAQALGKGWWDVIPADRQILCWREPASALGAGRPPMIVYRRGLAGGPPLYALIESAAIGCGLASTPPRIFVETFDRSPPKARAEAADPSTPPQAQVEELHPPPPSTPVEPSGGGFIHVSVTVVARSKRLGGAKVAYRELPTGAVSSTIADVDGLCDFELERGQNYELSVEAEGFMPERELFKAPEGALKLYLYFDLEGRVVTREASSCDDSLFGQLIQPCLSKVVEWTAECNQWATTLYSGCASDPGAALACPSVALAHEAACRRGRASRRARCVRRANEESGCDVDPQAKGGDPES